MTSLCCVLESVRFGYWAVARRGIYFINFDVPSEAPRRVRFFNFESHTVIQVATVENTVSWSNTPGFAISPDGRWLLYSSLESTDADPMLVDNSGRRKFGVRMALDASAWRIVWGMLVETSRIASIGLAAGWRSRPG